MRPGRELDTLIARHVFGHRVWAQAKVLFENAEKGDRPLRNYSREVEWAFEVVKKMKMTIMPIVGGQWFAFVGPVGQQGWDSPTAVLEFLGKGEFEGCGACVGDNLPLIVCEAAIKAMEKRTALQTDATTSADSGNLNESAPEHEPLNLVSEPSNQDLRH
jgi:hypothetical protein